MNLRFDGAVSASVLVRTAVLLLSVGTGSICLAERPPKEIFQQMSILANVEASVQVCLGSADYKKLVAEEALKFHAVSLRAADILELIGKRYDYDGAYAFNYLIAQERSESVEFRNAFASQYSKKCAPQLLIDMNEVVNTVGSSVKRLIKR